LTVFRSVRLVQNKSGLVTGGGLRGASQFTSFPLGEGLLISQGCLSSEHMLDLAKRCWRQTMNVRPLHMGALLIILSLVIATVSCGREAPLASTDGETVSRVEGTIAKVCQLVGDFDRERNQSTTSLTYTGYGVAGTDLGVSFEHGQKLMFLFGDTWERIRCRSPGRTTAGPTRQIPCQTMGLNLFYTGTPGKFLPPSVPGVSQGPFEVPMEGVDINGLAYVFFTTNHTEQRTMGRSVLARLDDESLSFTYLYSFSTDKFLNVQVAVINNSDFQSLPENNGRGLLIWGSGEYRKSNSYLAWMPYAAIEDKSKLWYFRGTDANNSPLWSQDENDAVALFHDPIIGEFSVFWNQYVNRWIMFYSRVSMRSAVLPWRPWSDREIVFDAVKEGYTKFIHWPGKDNLSDPMRESTPGGPYGPYVVEKFTKGSFGRSTVYFTLSTWNPYTTVLMKVDLELRAAQRTETTARTSMRTTETATTNQVTHSAETATAVLRTSIVRLGILAIVGFAIIVIAVALLRKRRTESKG
jgi:hypothetical protein